MSVQKRMTKAGKARWIARYRDHTGKEHSKSFDTQREAKAWVSAQTDAMRRGEWIDPAHGTTTMRQLAEAWEVQARNDATRLSRHSLTINLGPLSGMRIGDVTPTDVRAWIGLLQHGRPWADGARLAPNTIALSLGQLKTMLRQAEDDGLITRNPAAKVRAAKPTTTVTLADIPTPLQVSQLIDAAMRGVSTPQGSMRPSPALAAAIRLDAATGMRVGEVAGMTWMCVNLDRKQVSVIRQATSSSYALRELKTGSSGRRVVTIDEATAAMLGRLPRKHERVFLNATGRPYSSLALTQKFIRLARLCDMPAGITMKSLRHFHATELLAAGVPVHVVQHRLGHSNASKTLDVYAHFVPSTEGLAVDTIAGVLDGAGLLRDRRSGMRVI